MTRPPFSALGILVGASIACRGGGASASGAAGPAWLVVYDAGTQDHARGFVESSTTQGAAHGAYPMAVAGTAIEGMDPTRWYAVVAAPSREEVARGWATDALSVVHVDTWPDPEPISLVRLPALRMRDQALVVPKGPTGCDLGRSLASNGAAASNASVLAYRADSGSVCVIARSPGKRDCLAEATDSSALVVETLDFDCTPEALARGTKAVRPWRAAIIMRSSPTPKVGSAEAAATVELALLQTGVEVVTVDAVQLVALGKGHSVDLQQFVSLPTFHGDGYVFVTDGSDADYEDDAPVDDILTVAEGYFGEAIPR